MKEFYKKNKRDSIYWVKGDGKIGMHLFSFDKENPFWANFFKGRM